MSLPRVPRRAPPSFMMVLRLATAPFMSVYIESSVQELPRVALAVRDPLRHAPEVPEGSPRLREGLPRFAVQALVLHQFAEGSLPLSTSFIIRARLPVLPRSSVVRACRSCNRLSSFTSLPSVPSPWRFAG